MNLEFAPVWHVPLLLHALLMNSSSLVVGGKSRKQGQILSSSVQKVGNLSLPADECVRMRACAITRNGLPYEYPSSTGFAL